MEFLYIMENIKAIITQNKPVGPASAARRPSGMHWRPLSKKLLFNKLGECSPLEKCVWLTHYLYRNWETLESWLSFRKTGELLRVSPISVQKAIKNLANKNLLLKERRGKFNYYKVI